MYRLARFDSEGSQPVLGFLLKISKSGLELIYVYLILYRVSAALDVTGELAVDV